MNETKHSEHQTLAHLTASTPSQCLHGRQKMICKPLFTKEVRENLSQQDLPRKRKEKRKGRREGKRKESGYRYRYSQDWGQGIQTANQDIW